MQYDENIPVHSEKVVPPRWVLVTGSLGWCDRLMYAAGSPHVLGTTQRSAPSIVLGYCFIWREWSHISLPLRDEDICVSCNAINLSLWQEAGGAWFVTPHLTCVTFNDCFPWQHCSWAVGQMRAKQVGAAQELDVLAYKTFQHFQGYVFLPHILERLETTLMSIGGCLGSVVHWGLHGGYALLSSTCIGKSQETGAAQDITELSSDPIIWIKCHPISYLQQTKEQLSQRHHLQMPWPVRNSDLRCTLTFQMKSLPAPQIWQWSIRG